MTGLWVEAKELRMASDGHFQKWVHRDHQHFPTVQIPIDRLIFNINVIFTPLLLYSTRQALISVFDLLLMTLTLTPVQARANTGRTDGRYQMY